MIKELNELVWYAERTVRRADKMLAFLCNGQPEIMSLYHGLYQQEYRTDEDAAKSLGMGLTSYKKYGKALREHLKDMTLFFNDEKAGVDSTVKNIFEGARETTVMRMLSWRSCRVASRETALQLLRRGIHYEWPEFVVEATLVLKEIIVRGGGTAADYDYYAHVYRRYKRYLDIERLSREYYQRIKLQSQHKAGSNDTLAQQIRIYLEELQPCVGQTASYFFHLHYYTLRNHYCMNLADYTGLRRNCEEAIRFFASRKYPVVNPLSIFYYTKVVAHTMLGQYDAGVLDAEKSLKIPEEGTVNWFSAMEAYIYLSIHTRHYEKAFELYKTAYNHRRRSALQPDRQEIWHTLGAYCNILQQLTDTPPPEDFPKFKSRQFLNNIQNYSRDKDGMYVAILVAHVLLQLVEEREEEEFQDRLLTLEKYRNRYLRKSGSGTDRSVLFIKMLGLLPRADYCRESFLQKSQPFLSDLNRAPLQLANQAHELEIVPFEHLVELIAGYLERKRRRK